MKTKIEGYVTKAANGDEAKLKEYMESYEKCKEISMCALHAEIGHTAHAKYSFL
jgi:hypothetical protein